MSPSEARLCYSCSEVGSECDNCPLFTNIALTEDYCVNRRLEGIEARIKVLEKNYMFASSNYGSDSREVRDKVEEVVYLRGWFSVIVQGGPGKVLPFDQFKKTDVYPSWQESWEETLQDKSVYWSKHIRDLPKGVVSV